MQHFPVIIRYISTRYMINGRVNESKESDFMKMKKILVSMFLLFLVLCLKSNVSNAA